MPKSKHHRQTAKQRGLPCPAKQLRSSKSQVFQEVTQVVIPAQSPAGEYISLIFATPNGTGSAVFTRIPGQTADVISRSPSSSAPFGGVGLFPVGSQNDQWAAWQRQFNLFTVEDITMQASCTFGAAVGQLSGQYICRDETGILCDSTSPGLSAGQLGPLTYIESIEQMKFVKFSAFPKKQRMRIDYRPILAATQQREYLQTRVSTQTSFQDNWVTDYLPGILYFQRFTLLEPQTVPITIATALIRHTVRFCESAVTTNAPLNAEKFELLIAMRHQRILAAKQDLEKKEDEVVCEKPMHPLESDVLRKSQIMSLFEMVKSGQPPSHLEGRVGEAKNPGPLDDIDCA